MTARERAATAGYALLAALLTIAADWATASWQTVKRQEVAIPTPAGVVFVPVTVQERRGWVGRWGRRVRGGQE